MALVAYDYGSDSEEDEDVQPKVDVPSGSPNEVHLVNTVNNIQSTSDISDEDEAVAVSKSTTSIMFDKLPQKQDLICDTDFEDKVEDFVPKAQIPIKPKAKVKISIPSLSDFDDLKDELPSSKKLKLSMKGSGLLSLLPPVKCVPLSNKSFVPNILTSRSKVSSESVKKSRPLIPSSVKKVKAVSAVKVGRTDSDNSDEDIELPETFDEELWQKTCGKPVKKDIIVEEPLIEEPTINLAPEAVQPYDGLDNKAFKELVGKSNRIPRNIKLIDVNEAELVAEKDLWMTKSLTDPDFVPKKSIEDPVDPTKRKKHHITYLAQQAKANEQELQGQWASSKFNRNQSRAKYGF